MIQKKIHSLFLLCGLFFLSNHTFSQNISTIDEIKKICFDNNIQTASLSIIEISNQFDKVVTRNKRLTFEKDIKFHSTLIQVDKIFFSPDKIAYFEIDEKNYRIMFFIQSW
jgi:hypothetical protein